MHTGEPGVLSVTIIARNGFPWLEKGELGAVMKSAALVVESRVD